MKHSVVVEDLDKPALQAKTCATQTLARQDLCYSNPGKTNLVPLKPWQDKTGVAVACYIGGCAWRGV